MSRKKILYGINGTGQGHISRAKALIPKLMEIADVDLLISGERQDLNFDYPLKYKFTGFTFIYERGGVNWVKTFLKVNIFSFIKDIFTVKIKKYDFIVSDFEPVSAWSCLFKRKKCINLSHQASFFSCKTPRPKFWFLNIHDEIFMRIFAITNKYIGIHFKPYSDKIISPLLKDEIIESKPFDAKTHITIYLSAFSFQKQVEFFKKFPDFNFQIFHSQCEKVETIQNLSVSPLSEKFKYSLISSSGYISNAGFESNAEALYLRKPLLCIPIKHQYEQTCNGEALKQMGVTVIKNLDFQKVKHWLENKKELPIIEIADSKQLAKSILDYGTELTKK